MAEPHTAAPPATLPETVARYDAYLRTRTTLASQATMKSGAPVLTISHGTSTLTVTFIRHKNEWRVGSILLRTSDQTASFTQGSLTRAVAAFLDHIPAT